MSLNSDYSLSDIAAVTGSGANGGAGFWGSEWIWIIVLFLFAGNGWGGGWGGGQSGGSEVQRGFDHSSTIMKLDGITTGIADATYALNNTMMNGFFGVNTAISGLGSQLASCCCETQRAIDGVNYNLATQSCETRHAIENSTRQILDFLTTDKISTLQSENQALRTQNFISANQEAQTAELIRRLGRDVPVPAYVVPNPNCCYGATSGCGTF